MFAGGEDLSRAIERVAQLGAQLLLQSAVEAEVAAFLGRDRYRAGRVAVGTRILGCATGIARPRSLSSALWLPVPLTCTDASWPVSSTGSSTGSEDRLRFLFRRVAGAADDRGRALFAEGDRERLS